MAKKTNKRSQPKLAPLTAAQVREIAIGIYRHTIFTNAMIPHPDLMPFVFLPYGHFTKKQIAQLKESGACLFWAWSKDAVGFVGNNGYPVFEAMNIASAVDAQRISEEYDRIVALVGSPAPLGAGVGGTSRAKQSRAQR